MRKIKSILFFLSLSFNLFGQQSDTLRIEKHLTAITKTKDYRHFKNVDQLNKTAAYIYNNFKEYADTTYFQEYEVNGEIFKNVICVFNPALLNSFGIRNSETIVVGAHYDVCGLQEGADDNASGIVGLLELARMLKGQSFSRRIELVAYTLEEPPFFRSEYMGSYIHAKSLVESKTNVYGMISVEMIGHFKEEKKTQDYPLGFLKLIYGSRGNYITLVNKLHKGKFARKFTREYKRSKTIRTKKFSAPKSLPGIDFSDHLNYWKFGFSAMMITDTSFYRNKNYHQDGDKMEALDIPKMAKVIDGLFQTMINL